MISPVRRLDDVDLVLTFLITGTSSVPRLFLSLPFLSPFYFPHPWALGHLDPTPHQPQTGRHPHAAAEGLLVDWNVDGEPMASRQMPCHLPEGAVLTLDAGSWKYPGAGLWADGR